MIVTGFKTVLVRFGGLPTFRFMSLHLFDCTDGKLGYGGRGIRVDAREASAPKREAFDIRNRERDGHVHNVA
jgi:hypothetical protein